VRRLSQKLHRIKALRKGEKAKEELRPGFPRSNWQP
jgi:hypothetical protein